MRKLLGLLMLLCSVSSYALDREISVKGSSEFKIKFSESAGAVKGDSFQNVKIAKENDSWAIKDKSGKVLAQAVKNGEELHLKNDSATQYIVKFKDNGYSVYLPTDELLNRVKIKEDKFNLYNKSAARLLHGKQKEDGFGVKDEKGEQLIKIKGVESLREASHFALQIPAEFQIVFWLNSLN